MPILTADHMGELKVLVYNIAANYPGYSDYARIDKLREVLVSGNWDVIGLNEVYNRTLRKILIHDQVLQEQYPYQVYAQDEYSDLPFHTFDSGLVVLSKHPILRNERYQYKKKLTEGMNKIFPPKDLLYCQINLSSYNLDFFFTHLQWGDEPQQVETRKEHFKELRSQVDHWQDPSTPTIVCGDMNIYGYPDRTDQYSTFMSHFPEFKDTYHDLHPNDPAITWSPDNAKVFKWYSGERFDYILVSRHFDVETAEILPYRHRVGPYILKWSPSSDISIWDRLRLDLKRVLRFLLFPLHLIIMVGLTFYRVKNGYKQILFLREKDLSDHYALQSDLRYNE